MTLDLARLRAETPGCAHVLHLNAAGSALPSQRTLDATLKHLKLEAEIGGYEAAAKAHDELEGFYPAVARLIGAEADEVAFVENATRAWDLAFYSLDFKPGDRILTCVSEYSSNYISYLQVARKTGAEIVVVPDDNYGQIDLGALRACDRQAHQAGVDLACTDPRWPGAAGRGRRQDRQRCRRCSTCSTPASRSASCRSTCARSAATSCR